MFVPYSVEKNMCDEEKLDYYKKLREYCEVLSLENKKEMSLGQQMISKVYNPSFYNNKIEVLGENNIPSNEPVIFVCNHSNSHDIFSMYSILEKIGISSSVMVASDCLNLFSISAFAAADSVFLDRNNKISSNNSIYKMASRILAGKSGVVFGESTWNLHPIKPMQNLKIGSTKIAAITGALIIPTILEYVEIPELCNKEFQLYEKAVVAFGKPYKVQILDDLSMDTSDVQISMENIRKNIWNRNSICRKDIKDINVDIYLNHVYLKKFKAFGFKYDSLKESKFLRKDSNGLIENEYCLSEDKEFVPGITYQKKIKM